MAINWQTRAVLAAGLSLTLLLGVWADWAADPFIRNDDYLTFFPAPDLLYQNTLNEGRWLNQVWAWRGFQIPAPWAYAIAMGLWCLSMSLAAAKVFARDDAPWRTLIAAAALATAPQWAQLMFWFNIQVSNAAVLAVSIAALCIADQRRILWILPAAVTAAVLSYPTNAFIILAVALAVTPATGMGARWAICGVFLVSLLGALALSMGINYAAHGLFGLVLPDWRQAAVATDLDGLVRNIDRLAGGAPGGVAAVVVAVVAVIVLTFVIALRSDRPVQQRGLALGLSLSLLVLAVVTVISGVLVPNRSTGFIWVFLFLAAATSAARGRLSAAIVMVLFLPTGLLGWWLQFDPAFERYQERTRALATEIQTESPEADLIVLEGPLSAWPETDVIMEPLAFSWRLQHLTFAKAVHCPPGISPPLPPEPSLVEAPRFELEVARRAACQKHRAAIQALPADQPDPAEIAPGVVAVRLAR
ncbi:MAG: glucosyltransferase domain-containing protein [Pseudomonadota bacterium]